MHAVNSVESQAATFQGSPCERIQRADFHNSRSLRSKFQSRRPATILRKPRAGAATFQRSRELLMSSRSASGHLFDHRIGSQLAMVAAKKYSTCIHAVGEPVGRVAADNQDSLLHHEPGHRAHAAGDDQHAPLHRDSGTGGCVAPDDDGSVANRGSHRIARVTVDNHRAQKHALGGSPAGPAVHQHGGADVQARDVVAGASLRSSIERPRAARCPGYACLRDSAGEPRCTPSRSQTEPVD